MALTDASDDFASDLDFLAADLKRACLLLALAQANFEWHDGATLACQLCRDLCAGPPYGRSMYCPYHVRDLAERWDRVVGAQAVLDGRLAELLALAGRLR